MCVCACVRTRERDRESDCEVDLYLGMYVCERRRERVRNGEIVCVRYTDKKQTYLRVKGDLYMLKETSKTIQTNKNHTHPLG